ncbi:GRB2-related adapter protein-like [Xenia sp. Carnegie-2017]|uniref:GRB2-related adapter protein-like n=1 Tax=Xenia sp. Carnegie-2017 TaxID=2897299 RepID=UPI001F03FE6A|nr:GRB2-related adapter protein-like [Xenia sp. Carnegie-2017]
MARGVPPWYHGKISADEATKILVKFGQPSAFLLRDSQYSEATFTLSVTGPRQERDGKFNIQHYRIVKKTNNRSQWDILSFPSRNELRDCMLQQAPESRLKLVTPVEKPLIEKWNSTDKHWRDRITLCNADRDVKEEVPVETKKKPRKRTGMLNCIRQLFRSSHDHTDDEDDHIYATIDDLTPSYF